MMRIVVADDEVEIRRLVINNLNQTGRYMVVGEAGTGEEALSEILRTKPDALVTDICMPHMDGLELTAELVRREIPIRVVIVSGYDDFTYAKKAITYGVDDYLLKPFLPSELYTVLDAIATSLAQRQYCNLDRDAARRYHRGRRRLGDGRGEDQGRTDFPGHQSDRLLLRGGGVPQLWGHLPLG